MRPHVGTTKSDCAYLRPAWSHHDFASGTALTSVLWNIQGRTQAQISILAMKNEVLRVAGCVLLLSCTPLANGQLACCARSGQIGGESALTISSVLHVHHAGIDTSNSSNFFLPTVYDVDNDLPDQRAALERFYSAVNGPAWNLSFLPNITTALGSAPPSVIQFLTDPTTTSAQKEANYLQSITGKTGNGFTAAMQLAFFKFGLAPTPWLTSGSYCSW